MKKLVLFFICYGLCTVILQSQTISKTLNVNTPGMLSDLLTSTESTTVTDLSITGTIDARDIMFMRNTMSALANLDISGVNIAAYTGEGGTAYGSYTYPANEMPMYSFVFVSYPIITMGKLSLKSIKLPNSITSIGNRAFYRCSGLTGPITIPDSVTSIASGAFTGCSGVTVFLINAANSKYSSIDGAIFSKDQTAIFAYPGGKTGEYQIPDKVATIESSAFSECRNLTGSLTIPNSVTTIGGAAFYTCFGLTGSLSLPDSLTSIGGLAFEGCGFSGSLTIPNSVKTIGVQAFRNCSNLTGSLKISNSVSAIEFGAFAGCGHLTGSLVIPNSVTTIGSKAFLECSGFSELFLPHNITNISDEAFNNCSFLKISSANPAPPTISDMTFGYLNFYSQLIVPSGSKAAYESAPYWSRFTYITEQDFTTGSTPKEGDFSKIYAANDLIVIESSATNARVEIFSTTGRLVKTIYTQGDRTEVSLPGGIYIVRMGNHTQKVILQKQ